MENALAAIQRLCQSKRLLPAEQLIMSTVDSLDPFLESIKDEKMIVECENTIMQLFSINSGDLVFSVRYILQLSYLLSIEIRKSRNFGIC